jgi:2'-5' RNA ligase
MGMISLTEMKKPVSNRLYLVATPSGEVKSCALRLQTMFNKRYRLYEQLPPVHMTMEVIDLPDAGSERKVIELIGEVTENSPPFDVIVEGLIAFPEPYKSIALKVMKNPSLRIIAARINNRLAEKGYTVRSDLSDWDYHITVAGAWNAANEWSYHQFARAFDRVRDLNLKVSCKISRLELWLPRYQPRLAVLAWFPLLGKANEVEKEIDQIEVYST